MDEAATQKIAHLDDALTDRDWKTARQILHQIPTTPPKTASPYALAASLELVRAAAATLREACDYATAFEAAFATRRSLLRERAAEWAVRALEGFAPFAPVVAALSAVLGLLAIGVEGRCIVGNARAVDCLTLLWPKHRSCSEIVSALLSLCSGHIDNVSRFMRRRGISVAIDVLRDPVLRLDARLVQQTLILIGFCAICTPDNTEEGAALVPALLDTLQHALQRDQLDFAVHTLFAFATIGDCWLKESHGYDLADSERIVMTIICLWDKNIKSRRMSEAASWALCALSSGHPSVQRAVDRHATSIFDLTTRCAHVVSSVQLLHDGLQHYQTPSSVYDSPVSAALGHAPPSPVAAADMGDVFPDAAHSAGMPLSSTGVEKRRRGRPRRSRILSKAGTAVLRLSKEGGSSTASPTRIQDVGRPKRQPRRSRCLAPAVDT